MPWPTPYTFTLTHPWSKYHRSISLRSTIPLGLVHAKERCATVFPPRARRTDDEGEFAGVEVEEYVGEDGERRVGYPNELDERENSPVHFLREMIL
jgi:hypothetical protein